MSKLNEPTIRETKSGSKIKSKYLQLIEEDTFIISKILNYCFGIYNNNIEGGYLSSEYWIFKLKSNIKMDYFMVIYKKIIKNELEDISGGAGMPRIKYEKFMSIKIPLPNIEKQKEYLDQMKIMKQKIINKKKELELLEKQCENYILSELNK